MNNKLYKIFFILSLLMSFSLDSQEMKPFAKKQYFAQDFSHLIGMQGFSDELLKLHFTLYERYVTNVNLVSDLLNRYLGGSQDYEFQTLKRQFAWEFNGMRLHEYYFGNLGGKKALNSNDPLYKLILRDFGSYENWKKDFIATGMIRGIGYSILYLDSESGRLFNCWINEHDLGHLAGGKPILVMDVFEHAYMPQYGLDKAKYIDAFFKNVNWEEASARLEAITTSTNETGTRKTS